jgi:hypothetical protein
VKLKANKYREEHSEENIERCKDWYEKNKEIKKDQSRQWKDENRQYVRNYFKKYIKTEHGKKVMQKLGKFRRMNKKHEITKEEWILCKEYFKNNNGEYCCAYCGLTEKEHKELYNQQLHKEHVDCHGNNNISNCIPACKICNSNKGILSIFDWYNSHNPIFAEERLIKILRWISEDYKKAI